MHFQRPNFNTLTTYLILSDARAQIKFIEDTFDGKLHEIFERKDGSVMHAEMSVGDSMIMNGEGTNEIGLIPASMYIYVENCDKTCQLALTNGAELVIEPTTMIHAGQRYGAVKDTNGNVWWIATHLEDIDSEEETRRIRELGI